MRTLLIRPHPHPDKTRVLDRATHEVVQNLTSLTLSMQPGSTVWQVQLTFEDGTIEEAVGRMMPLRPGSVR